MTTTEPFGSTIYLAAPGYEAELATELGRDVSRVIPGGPLFSAPGPARDVAWAANTWLDPVRVRFVSIADAATALITLGSRWSLLSTALHRRASLIAEKLPRVEVKPIMFPMRGAPPAPLGSWTLADQNLIVAAPRCSSPFPNGEVPFVEDHVRPPSRAYLKLWEAFTVAGRAPKPGDRCVDLGSSPGGWTWALERLGARVISVDKAPIDERLTRLTRVRYVKDSAFAVEPTKVGRVDWLVSDVICYPARIVKLVQRWIEVHPRAGYVITIKFQGKMDMEPLRELASIAGGRLVHLSHNKHELTWLRPPPDDAEGDVESPEPEGPDAETETEDE